MKAAPNGPGSDLRRLRLEDLQDSVKAEEALASWDELDPALLTAIERHPQHGPRLAMLRHADLWLRKDHDPGSCPSAGELYDYGRGPGYGPLPSSRRAEIERHLVGCGECEAHVETLATPPPVPLDSPGVLPSRPRIPAPVRSPARGPSPILLEPVAPPRRRVLPRLVPLAVAASLVLALGIWIGILPSASERLAFPQAPLLRGSSGGPLHLPRGKILRVTPAVTATFPALAGTIVFEIEPQDGASSYQIDLQRHGGDAFAADEEVLTRLSGDAPIIQATLDLPAGSYTWTARAIVRGLALELGSRDFEVVEDPVFNSTLAALEGMAEPDRSLKAVQLLHEFGHSSGARQIARSMPASPERDAYLGRVPGR